MNTAEEMSHVRDEIIERGQQIYETRLREILEQGNRGDFVAVEPETERYFLGGTGGEALFAAHQAMPEKQFYLKRIGSAVTYRLGGYGNRQR